MGEGELKSREAPSESCLAIRDSGSDRRCVERSGRVAEAMLAELGDLDPGKRSEGSSCPDHVEPGGLGVAVPPEAPKEPRPLAEQPALGPGGISTSGIGSRPGVGQGVTAGTAAEIGAPSGRPPRSIVVRVCRDDLWSSLADGAGRRGAGACERRLHARERLGVTTRTGECPGQAGEVAGRRFRPAFAVGIAPIHVDEESAQRADILAVVMDDREQPARVAVPEVLEVAAGDLPAADICVPLQAEQLRLDGGEAGVGHPVAKDPADQRQKIEVTRVGRRAFARHPVARHEQGPIEPSAVVRDQPGGAWNPARELGEQGRLVGMVGQQELDLAEAAAFPPPEADEKRQRARSGRETGRLGVETDEGSAGRWLAGQAGEPLPVDREERRR